MLLFIGGSILSWLYPTPIFLLQEGLYCGLSAYPLGTRSPFLDLYCVEASNIKFQRCAYTCFPSFESVINAHSNCVFSLSLSSCILPHLGSESKPLHNVSLWGHFRAACTQMGFLDFLYAQKDTITHLSSLKTLCTEFSILWFFIYYIWSPHQAVIFGRWPELELCTEFLIVSLYLYQVFCPSGWTSRLCFDLLGFGILRVQGTLARKALM